MPTEAAIRGAQRRLEGLLARHGLLLLHDAKLPSATACIAGVPVPGSWWGHAEGKLIYAVLERMEPAVAWAKLVLGKETLVHARLWPALVGAAECGQDWQLRGLKPDAQRLLQLIRKASAPLRTDQAARWAGGRKPGVVATELERRLLAHSHSEHTSSGHHARTLETWAAWAKRQGLPVSRWPGPAEALAALSAPVLAWTGGRKPPGLLPWFDED
jgi:hypothetical protein